MTDSLQQPNNWSVSSAFKGQLYFQVGTMEVPNILGAKHGSGGGAWKGRRSPFPLGDMGAIPQKNFQKSTFKSCIFCIFAN